MIKKLIKFFILKIKFGRKLLFDISDNIGFDSEFEGANRFYKNVSFSGKMGYGSYIADNVVLCGEIGRFSSIAPNVTYTNSTHPYTYPFVSTSPVFISTLGQTGEVWVSENRFNEFRNVKDNIPIVIGNDCWIGQNVFIIGGTRISDGAVVLAGAVVTKDVPPYAIVGGIPAKIVKYRYSDEDIKFLLKIKWWNQDISWIKENSDLFTDFEQFKKRTGGMTL